MRDVQAAGKNEAEPYSPKRNRLVIAKENEGCGERKAGIFKMGVPRGLGD